MIEELPKACQSEWLSRVDPATIQDAEFPLADILRDSLYYPASGFDGDPVRYLAGNVLSFVYVDYGHSRKELDDELTNPGFRGYEVIARRKVKTKELVPRERTPPPLSPADGGDFRYRMREWTPFPSSKDRNPFNHFIQMKQSFCSWIIMQRCMEMPASHGPKRFSFLYLCADGVAAFQALYVANGISPALVAVIQPGAECALNWTNFECPERIFARSVLENPAGRPRILLYGGRGKRDWYLQPCWPDYSERLCFLERADGSIGVWRDPQQPHSADDATRHR